ncbi:MAG: hypothetical protein KDI17_17755 [Halioglobus sp.]|nr:hypothetical protein [Halioglobus sp.]
MSLWRNYFGEQCEIHGLDIDPCTRDVVEDDITVHIGSQGDPGFLTRIAQEYGPFDLIIDDGSHFMAHQICSFEALYPTMSERGVYVCEDTFTSYWREYGGKVGGSDTFVEYAKKLVDELHAYWATDDKLIATPFTKSTEGIYFYSGAIVFERAPVQPPVNIARHKNHVGSVSVAELKHSAKITTQGALPRPKGWRQRLKRLLNR